MLNIAVIMGRLTVDPELRTTQNGISVCSFSVAVERNYSNGGERQTDFINCVAWRQTAEFISRYFRKGSMIAINGNIQQRQYTDNNGNKRNAFEILVDNANFCGSKAESGNNADVRRDDNGGNAADVRRDDNGDFEEMTMTDEDLPFN